MWPLAWESPYECDYTRSRAIQKWQYFFKVQNTVLRIGVKGHRKTIYNAILLTL